MMPKEESEPPSIHPTKKRVKSRRRLHEAEVISTTPCTAPRRSPQAVPPNLSHSPIRPDAQVPPRDSQLNDTSSVNGTIHEYSRISNKTGGFEGSLPLQFDLIFADDDTVQFNNTVQSSPEIGKAVGGRRRGGRDTKQNRLFPRRLMFGDRELPQQRRGFFNRWTSIGSTSKPSDAASSPKRSDSQPSTKQPSESLGPLPRMKRSSRATTSSTIEDTSSRTFTKSQNPVTTPVRSSIPSNSPRFILPDETPPGSASKGSSRKSKGSIANTSAAVVERRSLSSSDDHGFELSIASAPPTYSSPRRERSAPVDLDEVDEVSSSEEGVKTRLGALTFFSKARSLSISPSKRRPNETKKSPARCSSRSLLPLLNSDNESDVSNFSVQPLHSMEDMKLESTAAFRSRQSNSHRSSHLKKKNWVVPIRRKGPHSSTAVSLLEKERLAAMDSKALFLENKDTSRKDRNQPERKPLKRESDEVQSLSPDQRESIFANIELVEKDSSAGTYQWGNHAKNANLTQSTISSSKDALVKLPRCVVCNGRDRSHIAIPCMHFAYCRECAMRLAKTGKGCVLCSNQHVTFAAVSV